VLDEFTSRSFRREPQPLLQTEEGRGELREALMDAVRGEAGTASAGVGGIGEYEGSEEVPQPAVMFGVCASTGAAARFALDKYVDGILPAATSPTTGGTVQRLPPEEMELRLIEGVSDVREYTLPTFLKYAPGLHFYATPLPGQVRRQKHADEGRAYTDANAIATALSKIPRALSCPQLVFAREQERGVILQIGDRQISHLPLGLFGMPERC